MSQHVAIYCARNIELFPMCGRLLKSKSVGVFVHVSQFAVNVDSPLTAAMCVLFVDKFAGCLLLQVFGLAQTHSQVKEHTCVTVRLTDGAPLKMSQSNHQLVEDVMLLILPCQYFNASPFHLTALQRFGNTLPLLIQSTWARLFCCQYIFLQPLAHQRDPAEALEMSRLPEG